MLPRHRTPLYLNLHGTSTRTENRSNFLGDAFLFRVIPFRGIPPGEPRSPSLARFVASPFRSDAARLLPREVLGFVVGRH